jgi:hypothetical protein
MSFRLVQISITEIGGALTRFVYKKKKKRRERENDMSNDQGNYTYDLIQF